MRSLWYFCHGISQIVIIPPPSHSGSHTHTLTQNTQQTNPKTKRTPPLLPPPHLCGVQVEFSHSLHPSSAHDAAIYDAAGLLNQRSFFAHGTQLSASAQQLMSERGAAVIHCPLSNFYFGDGLLNVIEALGKGLTVGLGTDVAGGYSPSMLQAVRMAVVNSHAIKAAVLTPDATAAEAAAAADRHVLNWQQGLWLGTMGGAKALRLEGVVGSFAVGKEFDALVVDCGLEEVFDVFEDLQGSVVEEGDGETVRVLQLVEMFVHLGDDRNIRQVYVQGELVGGSDAAGAAKLAAV